MASTLAARPLAKKAFIVGGHITRFLGARHPDFIWKRHPQFGQLDNPTLEDYIAEAANGALAAAGCPDGAAVDKMWIGNFAGELFNSQGHLGAALVGANPGLMNKPSMRVEGACASGHVCPPGSGPMATLTGARLISATQSRVTCE